MIPQCYGNSALFAVGKVAWSGLVLPWQAEFTIIIVIVFLSSRSWTTSRISKCNLPLSVYSCSWVMPPTPTLLPPDHLQCCCCSSSTICCELMIWVRLFICFCKFIKCGCEFDLYPLVVLFWLHGAEEYRKMLPRRRTTTRKIAVTSWSSVSGWMWFPFHHRADEAEEAAD